MRLVLKLLEIHINHPTRGPMSVVSDLLQIIRDDHVLASAYF